LVPAPKLTAWLLQSVTDEKFALCFTMVLNLNQGDLVLILRKLSKPMVVVVHGNQLVSAEATVLWDSCFATPRRVRGSCGDAIVHSIRGTGAQTWLWLDF